MATVLTPSSQKAGDRPISFLLDNQADGAPAAFVDLVIRPEELTRTDPSRMSVQQTLGGGWIDSFGAGLAQLTIQGHTGWRPTLNSQDDGLARMQNLKTSVFDQWHALRERNVERGLDPNLVRLIFSDALSERSMVVAPMTFTLRRSKSRPLLAQYQIAMTVVDEQILNLAPVTQFGYEEPAADMAPVTEEIALESIDFSVDTLEAVLQNGTATLNGVRQLVANELVAPVAAFLKTTTNIYKAIRGAIAEGTAMAGDLINVARMAAQAGANIFRSLAAVASIPKVIKASLMAVAGAFTNIFCTLRNAMSLSSFVEDYSSVYGASNCSSTAGGRPQSSFAGTNVFYSVVPTPGPMPIDLTPAAATQMTLLAQIDPVMSPPSPQALLPAMEVLREGFSTNENLNRYLPGTAAPLPLFYRPGEAEDKLHQLVNVLLPQYIRATP